MMRPPSFFARVTRALTGLVTVWSLGCCGFEPIIASLFAADGVVAMDCADSGDTSAGTVEAGGEQLPGSGAGAATVTNPSDDSACSCTNCLAPSPRVVSVILAPPLPGRAPGPLVASFPSEVRVPLVPPPQRA